MEDREVTSVIVDWFYDTENGEQFTKFTVGRNDVKAIRYHIPSGEGDKHFCDIEVENREYIRVFNINTISYK